MPDIRPKQCLIKHIIRHSSHSSEASMVAAGVNNLTAESRQAQSDDQLIELWIHGRSEHTQRAYRADARRFLDFAGKGLHQVTLGDIQAFADTLEEHGLQPASRNRFLSAVKSLFAFGHRLGYLPFDVARPLKIRGFRDDLADRILEEHEVQRMIALEPNERNQVILMTLYAAGLRVSELCGLKWCHLQGRNGGGQMTIFGKREKTRSILLPRSVWLKLLSLRQGAAEDAAVFRSRKGGHLITAQVTRIVKRAAERAGIPKAVTSHWLRHCHASHSLERDCPLHLVQATLGHSSIATTGRYLHARPQDSSARYLVL